MQRHAVMRLAAQDDSEGDSKQLASQHFSHNALAVTFIARLYWGRKKGQLYLLSPTWLMF